MIYTDGIHLVSDQSIEELHEFARKMELKRHWFQNHPRHPHYDLPKRDGYERAILAGAIRISNRELLKTTQRIKYK